MSECYCSFADVKVSQNLVEMIGFSVNRQNESLKLVWFEISGWLYVTYNNDELQF